MSNRIYINHITSRTGESGFTVSDSYGDAFWFDDKFFGLERLDLIRESLNSWQESGSSYIKDLVDYIKINKSFIYVDEMRFDYEEFKDLLV